MAVPKKKSAARQLKERDIERLEDEMMRIVERYTGEVPKHSKDGRRLDEIARAITDFHRRSAKENYSK